jgi:hypothetical protein
MSFDRSFELRVSSSQLAVCSGGADPNLSNLRHLRFATVPGFWFLVPRLADSEFWSLVSEF